MFYVLMNLLDWRFEIVVFDVFAVAVFTCFVESILNAPPHLNLARSHRSPFVVSLHG